MGAFEPPLFYRHCNLTWQLSMESRILIPTHLTDYEMLASGNGTRIERFGNNIVSRPDAACAWQMSSKKQAISARCASGERGHFVWQFEQKFNQDWHLNYEDRFSLDLRVTTSKNVGVFPEQASQWKWLIEKIEGQQKQLSVLNLFAYTGGATLAAASAGAQVCHVDASSSVVAWARRNAARSELEDAPIRWIVEDCVTFVEREVKRGKKYDIIVMDPPAFGHTPKGAITTFDGTVARLLAGVKQLAPEPTAFIFNGYAMGYSALVLRNMLMQTYPDRTIECGELALQDTAGMIIPCSIFARF